jgi:hypothetical protein
METVCFTQLQPDHIYLIDVCDRQQIQSSGIFLKYKKGNAIFKKVRIVYSNNHYLINKYMTKTYYKPTATYQQIKVNI